MAPEVPFPPGIDVCLRKAHVDPPFAERLLTDPVAAAASIGLELTATEQDVLAAIPPAELKRAIEQVQVPPEHRAVFKGAVGAAMVTVVLGLLGGCGPLDPMPAPTGIRPDDIPRQPSSPQPEEPAPGNG